MLFSLKRRPSFNRPSICRRFDSHTCFFLFFLFCFCLFGDVAFSEYFFVPFPLSLCMESRSYVLSFRMVFKERSVFLPCDHGLDFLHQLM